MSEGATYWHNGMAAIVRPRPPYHPLSAASVGAALPCRGEKFLRVVVQVHRNVDALRSLCALTCTCTACTRVTLVGLHSMPYFDLRALMHCGEGNAQNLTNNYFDTPW